MLLLIANHKLVKKYAKFRAGKKLAAAFK